MTNDGKRDACQTYVEQTKLLVALSSGFLIAPAAVLAHFETTPQIQLTHESVVWFVVAEFLFVASVLSGYVVLGCVTGSQDDGTYNVFRAATRAFSLLQLTFYLLGMSCFVMFVIRAIPHVGPAVHPGT